MALSLKPEHVSRYRDLARLLVKYGRSDIVASAGLDDALRDEAERAGSGDAAEAGELAGDLERLGPTFIKLGQLLSGRSDLLPQAHLEALSRLQDRVETFPAEQARQIIEEELGVRVSKAFASFEDEPLAAASLGQVHRATLRDGRPVVVKVQRPDVRERVAADIEALREIAAFVEHHTDFGRRYQLEDTLEQFARSLRRELDYLQEAGNLRTFAENLREFRRIVIPAPVEDYTTSRVLTMDYVRGRKVTAVGPLARMEIDGEALGEELFEAYLKQVLVDGVFHADPHAGNLFLLDDGRIALLDLGMVGRVTPADQERLLRLLVALSEGEGDEVARIALRLGERTDRVDETGFTRAVSQLVLDHGGSSIDELQVGRIVLEITRVSGEHGVRQPAHLSLLGKTLLNLDEVARILAPGFQPAQAVRRHAVSIMRRRMLRAASPGNVVSAALEMNELVQRLPGRINRVLDRIADNEMRLRVDAIDEERLISGLEKIANRIALGLVLAALIVGTAMMMRIETSLTIFGYPLLAALFFVAAAVGGVALIWSIVRRDRPPRGSGGRG